MVCRGHTGRPREGGSTEAAHAVRQLLRAALSGRRQLGDALHPRFPPPGGQQGTHAPPCTRTAHFRGGGASSLCKCSQAAAENTQMYLTQEVRRLTWVCAWGHSWGTDSNARLVLLAQGSVTGWANPGRGGITSSLRSIPADAGTAVPDARAGTSGQETDPRHGAGLNGGTGTTEDICRRHPGRIRTSSAAAPHAGVRQPQSPSSDSPVASKDPGRCIVCARARSVCVSGKTAKHRLRQGQVGVRIRRDCEARVDSAGAQLRRCTCEKLGGGIGGLDAAVCS